MDIMKAKIKLETFFSKNVISSERDFKKTVQKKAVLSNLSVTFEFLDQIVGLVNNAGGQQRPIRVI